MAVPEFRLFLDGSPATREQLDAVEEITVEQRVDAAWEARASYPLRVDDQGNWIGEEPYMRPFARYRVEIRLPYGGWVPLIDGPITSRPSPRAAEPGRSTLTLVVNDDSVLLNRTQAPRTLEGGLTDVVEQLFDHPAIADTDVDEPEGAAGGDVPPTVQQGTNMQLLRQLARQVDMHAYVLPGESPGESMGCFKAFPKMPEGLPTLYLLGPERNMDEFNVTGDAQAPATVRASAINFADKSVSSARSSPADQQLLGDQPAPAGTEQATAVAAPAYGGIIDPTVRATAGARRASRALDARGTVRGECYRGVLRPYQAVEVGGVKESESGKWVVSSVSHRITRNAYTQRFTLVRDAVTAAAGLPPPRLI